jgi:hypothetical protein
MERKATPTPARPPLTRLALLDDEPILSFEKDRLGVLQYADVIAGTALGSAGPFTIGVFGNWGEGKTSILRAAESRLNERATAETATPSVKEGGRLHNHVITVWFNAWQFEREERPIVPLVASIQRAVLARIDEDKTFLDGLGEKGKGFVKRLLRGGVKLLSAAKFRAEGKAGLPFVTEGKASAEIDGAKVADALQAFFGKEAAPDRTFMSQQIDQCLHLAVFDTLDDAREIASSITVGKGGEFPRIVVFIDDLDRCQPDKAFELIEAVKVVLAQPGFIFVLGLNRAIVDAYVETVWQDRLKEKYKDQAARYLDKIIQLPLYVRSHKKRFDEFVKDLLFVRLKDMVPKETLEVFAEVYHHFGETTAYGPRTLVRRINTLLVDQRLRPEWTSGDHKDVVGLMDKDFLGLCLVQRTLLDDLERATVLDMVKNDAFCEHLARLWKEAQDRKEPYIRDPIEAMYAHLEKVKEGRESKAKAEAGEASRPLESLPEFPRHAEWRRLLVKLDPFAACKYVLSTEHGFRWLTSRPCRDLVTDFVAARPEKPKAESTGGATGRTETGAGPTGSGESLPTIGPSAVQVASGLRPANVSEREWAEQIAIIERAARKSLGLKADAPLGPAEFARVMVLDLSYKPITQSGAAWLARPDSGLTALATLYLGSTQVDDMGAAALASKGSGLTALTSLYLHSTEVGDSGAAALAAKDSGLKALTTLSLHNTKVDNAGAAALAAKNSGLKALTKLDLSNTKVGNSGAAALAAKDSCLTALTTLHLNYTHVGDAGAAALAAKDSGLTALTMLNLLGTNVSKDAAAAIRKAHPNLKIIL